MPFPCGPCASSNRMMPGAYWQPCSAAPAKRHAAVHRPYARAAPLRPCLSTTRSGRRGTVRGLLVVWPVCSAEQDHKCCLKGRVRNTLAKSSTAMQSKTACISCQMKISQKLKAKIQVRGTSSPGPAFGCPPSLTPASKNPLCV